ncbi:hypothetical protein [Burkholderia sp. USMB20]|uniref:hypothetical protein n=1 Tax=Burkholderia sp. USMB20 TaxID=1571773 RepID=UPI000AE1A631|nr:hypothetical protein [Burkholderia sp. USMB20]
MIQHSNYQQQNKRPGTPIRARAPCPFPTMTLDLERTAMVEKHAFSQFIKET